MSPDIPTPETPEERIAKLETQLRFKTFLVLFFIAMFMMAVYSNAKWRALTDEALATSRRAVDQLNQCTELLSGKRANK